MEYTKACEEVGPFVVELPSKSSGCNYATQVNATCIGADFVTLHFDGPALSYDSLRYLVAIRPYGGNGNWSFYYHFSGADFTIGDLEEQTQYEISAYLLIGKSGFDYDYMCSEIVVPNVTTWPRSSITDVDGDGIPDACDPDDNDGPLGDTDHDGILNQSDDDLPPNLYPQLPSLACGVAANIPVPDPDHLLQAAQTGQIFFIHGFPILLEQVSGGQGTFSGKGVVGLPFAQAKYLEVEFHNVLVDSQRAIISGTVNGISQNLGNFPNLPLDTFTFGTDRFCKEVPEEEGFDENGIWTSTNSEYDPLGFNQEGQYQIPPFQGWEEGDPYDPNYDPNGFDADGNHIETGTPYNLNGCSQVGLDSVGQPCNPGGSGPYYWLAEGSTQEGIALANEVEDTIRPIVLAQLSNLAQLYNDSIFDTKIRCDLTRDSMREYFIELGYTNDKDRVFIFGPGDSWFKEGMSQQFKAKPENLGVNLDRNPNEGYLEDIHINLYNCDVELLKYQIIQQIINHFKVEPGISEVVDYLKGVIKRFSGNEASHNSDINNLKAWIFTKTDSIVIASYANAYSTGALDNLENEWEPGQVNKKPSNSLSSIVDNSAIEAILFKQAEEIIWQDIVFEYHQGWSQIRNIDRAYFLEAICKARERTRFSTGPSNYAPSFLPLEISKDILGQTYILYLDNIYFTPNGGFADVYIIINAHPAPDRLVFKALKVPLDPSGFISSTKLFLNSNVSIALSNAVKLNIIGNNNTHISFDCNGFSGISMDAEVEFCRNYIIPLYPGTLMPKPETESVKAHFFVQMPAWGEFIVNLSIDPFAITNHDSIKWVVNKLVFDFSNSTTPSYFHFPSNYSSPFTQNNNGMITASGLWKGFYLDNITITLPKQFGNNNGSSLTVGVNNMIFDDTGLTGQIFASPLLSICEGNLSGWPFSIDTFSIQITNNRLDGFTFNGLLNLPLFSQGNNGCAQLNECVRYEAIVLVGNNYSFSVKPSGNYQADIWKATVVIEPNSEIEIKFQNGSFLAKATLTGSITIDGDIGQNFIATIPNVAFQNVILRNKSPYFEPGLWSVPDASVGIGFGGFGLVIDSIKMIKVPSASDRSNLKFRVGMVIVDGDVGLLMVKGGFQLKGKLLIQNNRQRWVYDGLQVDNVSIDASFPGVDRVHGNLSFFGQGQPNSTLGRGFSGKVMVDFQGMDVELAAIGVFGNKGTFKYFMIDALAKFNPGIGVGVLQLVGFGGGASYHMNIIGDMESGLPSNIPNVDPSTIAIGTSLSGLVYSPDATRGINIHATVVMALAKEEAFNMNATFGVSFYSGGGIDKIYFKGTARFMDNLDFSSAPKFIEGGKPGIPTEVCAFVYISYEFGSKKFHGNFNVSINVADILKGQGEAEALIQPGYWFINVGTPQSPVFVSFTIPKLKITVAKVAFYFDIGKNIPAFPGLPSNVASLTGMGNIVANEALRRTGNGFASGMRFDISTGDINFLIFYAKLDLGVGFDLMMQDYGNAICVNNNGEQLGINGWYASGQLWAYIHGEVGIKVRLWGKKRHFEILSLSVAAALQSKFPNPFYARGAVGGRYKILGGLVKGKCRFEFSLGEECQIQGGNDPWADQEIISDLYPVDSLENVHSLTIPKATFAVPLNENLSDGNNIWRAEVVYANIVKDGTILNDEESFSEGKTILEIKPVNVLPSNQWLVFKVKARVLKNGEFFKFEEKEIAFKTGDAPTIIPVDNVKYAYPIDGQFNFYKNEHPNGKGFITLKFGQPELFQNTPTGYKRVMRLTKISNGNVVQFPFVYNSAQRRVEFSMPELLDPGSAYKLEMVNDSENGLLGLGNNSDESNGNEDANLAVPIILYQVAFRVSEFSKFADKVDALKQNLQVSTYSTGWIRASSTLAEPFDYYEIYGVNDQDEILNTTLNLNNLPWFAQNKANLKMVYNYQEEPVANTEPCFLNQFTNKYNKFDQQNFSESLIGFQEPLGNPILRLSPDGDYPALPGTITQHMDFTPLNGFSEMWGNMKMDLLSYKSLKCNGINWYGSLASNCSDFTYCCLNGAQQACCTTSCAYEGNPNLMFISDNDMPVPASGSKFEVSIRYNIPGYGLTTNKVIEVIKP